MYKLDDEFLAQLGLGAMPEEQKQAFLQHIYSELEIRVGEKLTDGMSDEQLDEFGQFVDKNETAVRAWFGKNLPNYKEDPEFKTLLDKLGPNVAEIDALSEFGATKWLQLNRPDYPKVVAETLETLKKEIVANKSQILQG
ncbi:MAG: DUF5663 domain-containing protein [Candidatus Nomurabacteria bacterium]|jgi:hypothetical protein|nr:DUF5663 domain-containing protein [Candidatus Nomurabacteria bacterium]